MIAVLITPTNIVVSDTLDVMIHQCSLLSNTEIHDTDLVDKSLRKVGQLDCVNRIGTLLLNTVKSRI